MADDNDPGRKATPEEASRAWAEVIDLMRTLQPWNLPKAAQYVRDHPPSAEAIAAFPWFAQRLLTHAMQSRKGPRAPKVAVDADQIEQDIAEYVREHGHEKGAIKVIARKHKTTPKTITKKRRARPASS